MGLLGFNDFRDMFDGGGAGASGPEFEGGPLSGLLNALGIKPKGYFGRQEPQRPMPRPQATMSTSSAPAPMPRPNPYAPGAVTTTPLSQSPNIGGLTPDQILAAINDGQTLPGLLELMRMEQERKQSEAMRGFTYGMIAGR